MRDRFLQNGDAAARCGFAGALISPEYPASGGGTRPPPFCFRFRLGLALTSGLRQKANPDTLLACPLGLARVADLGAKAEADAGVPRQPGDDSEEHAFPDGDRSTPGFPSESSSRAGDIPRAGIREGFPRRPAAAAEEPSTEGGGGLDCCALRRPGRNDSHEGAGDAREALGSESEEESGFGSASNFRDLDLNR